MKDSNFHLTTTKSTGWTRCLLLTSFDERRDRLDPFRVARTGFWLSFFRFQGATTHTSELGGAKYTISGFLRRNCSRVTPATGMPTLSARSAEVQITGRRLWGGRTTLAPRSGASNDRPGPSTPAWSRPHEPFDRGEISQRAPQLRALPSQ
jgi:hypothetical protein